MIADVSVVVPFLNAERALLRFWRLRRFERRLAILPHAVIAVSEDEAGLVRCLAPAARVVVAPNRVDANAMRPSPPGDAVLFRGPHELRPQ